MTTSKSSLASDAERKYGLRPLPRRSDESTLENAFRVFMSPADMDKEKFMQGDLISLRNESNVVGVAMVSRAVENNQGPKSGGFPVIRMSDFLRERYSFELQDKYRVAKWDGQFQAIESIVLTSLNELTASMDLIKFWTPYSLAMLDGIAVGGTFEVTPRAGPARLKRQRFLVEEIEPYKADKSVMVPYTFNINSEIIYKSSTSNSPTLTKTTRDIAFDFTGLFGLDDQISELETCIRNGVLAPRGRSRPILLYGSPGTGKTTVLSQLMKAKWHKTFEIDMLTAIGGETKVIARLQDLFLQAKHSAPSLIIIDQIDLIVGKGDATPLSETLAQLIKKSQDHVIQVVATAERYLDVQERLCRVLSRRIELPLPKIAAREQILGEVCNESHPKTLRWISERTHAFSAPDLHQLYETAADAAMDRSDDQPDNLEIIQEDFEAALQKVHATTMTAIHVDVPKVYWSEIGGSGKTKVLLQDIVNEFTRGHNNPFSVEPTRGVLLYGPPGCSKTMTAKALATESGLNFLSVKGPELISKWVGETEYNIREVFRKAREAAPSIIFFDEFDGLAKGSSGHDSLSPVKALLTELDGVVALEGVLVLAATNRPDLIDRALLRPGRFDELLYCGPPDFDGRMEILNMQVQNRPLQAESVKITDIAKKTENWSGAELVSLCKIAARCADREFIENPKVRLMGKHFAEAFSRVQTQITHEMLRGYKEFKVGGIGIDY